MITVNSKIITDDDISTAVKYAIAALLRDIENTCAESEVEGTVIVLKKDAEIEQECFRIESVYGNRKDTDGAQGGASGTSEVSERDAETEGEKSENRLVISASDDLGLIYGIYHISKTFLGVNEFWFWNEQQFVKKEGYAIPEGYTYCSLPYKVLFRGWFINDEVLIDEWKIDGDNDKPWEMAFEALLRCGGNMTIPGTDENAHIYCKLASDMGLMITHHHAEPLGARMFARAYPELDASYDRYPDLFEGLWREGIEKQKDYKVIWNLGFRGQGDRPFWADDPAYDTDEKRGKLISSLIRKQYDLIRSYDAGAICCSNLYGETMELYKKGLLDIPEDVIFIWADNGFGKMVSRRQGKHNPRVYALPEDGGKGRHGIYYHASFYDLQAAAQMTMLPNSPEFVVNELCTVFEKKADDFWIINSSNIKPHAYILDLIAQIWKKGAAGIEEAAEFVRTHREEYCRKYYSGGEISELYRLWPQYAPKYGPNADDHAGEQFANHGARVLATGLVTNFDKADPMGTKAADGWLWFSNRQTLAEQAADYMAVIEPAVSGYAEYLGKCEEVLEKLPSKTKEILEDTLIWQVKYLYYSYTGALHICRSIEACLKGKAVSVTGASDSPGALSATPDYLTAFYEAGLAAKAFLTGYDKMRSTEKGAFEGFFENDCEADIRQSHFVAKGLMSYLRFCGDGPHFYGWQRQFQQGAGGNKVHLILRIKKHLTDEDLWKLIDDGHRN